ESLPLVLRSQSQLRHETGASWATDLRCRRRLHVSSFFLQPVSQPDILTSDEFVMHQQKASMTNLEHLNCFRSMVPWTRPTTLKQAVGLTLMTATTKHNFPSK